MEFLEMVTEKTLLPDKDSLLIEKIKEQLIEVFFSKMSWWKEEYRTDQPDFFRIDLDRHSYMRYNICIKNIIPWIDEVFPLRDKDMIEIGCGTGSSGTAFSTICSQVWGYDIDLKSIDAAKKRKEVMEIDNVDFTHAWPSKIQALVMENHAPESLDIVLFYAVLEHQTVAERIESLQNAWTLLKPGNILVVVETPNRLTFEDWHTSQIDFFLLLPLELQLLYYNRSPRNNFVSNIDFHAQQKSQSKLLDLLTRWGQGVSYHEFELVFGNLEKIVLNDGYHPMMRKLRPIKHDETLLQSYIIAKGLKVPIGFTRQSIDVILRKN